jgi:glycosyltransferase involved in cell wall biosynthesis
MKVLHLAPPARSTSSGQARSTGSGQAHSTSSGQARSTGSGQARSTGSGQAQAPHAITAHTFIDEEIHALVDAGITCLTVSDTATEQHVVDRVTIIPVPRPAPIGSVLGTIGMAIQQAAMLPGLSPSHARSMFHALRTEHTAATVIREQKVDLVHSHFGWPDGFGGMLAASQAGVPLVASLRGMDLLHRRDIDYGLRQQDLYDRTMQKLLQRADRTIYATNFMHEAGLRAGAPAKRAVVIRKGVDLERFHPPSDRVEAQRALQLSGPVILAIGTLRPVKGYAYLFEALARLLDREWTLVICGDGPDRQRLEQRAAELFGKRVRFAGIVGRDRIAAYFAAADIFAHAAVVEAAGNVILEALASACAVVAADGGGPGEHIIDGETGFVVPPENASELSTRLRQLIEQPDLRRQLGGAGRREAERKYEYKRMIEDLIDVYLSACAGSRRPVESTATRARAATKSTSARGIR